MQPNCMNQRGFLRRGISLEDWLFDLDEEPDRQRIVAAVLFLITDQATAQAPGE